jgi:hypothetical protein
LERFTQKHSSPAAQSFSLFKSVFNPDVQANYFDVFDQFEGIQSTQETFAYDLSVRNEDPIRQIQGVIALHSDKRLILTGNEESMFYEVYLPFLGAGRIRSFIPKDGP